MTNREFYRAVSNGKQDVLQLLIEILAESETSYCVIGGLAVNAYVEPIISLDVDIVVAVGNTERVIEAAERRGFKTELFPHYVNLNLPDSDLRLQLQTDLTYQDFIPRAETKEVLGYSMAVARLKDVLAGKKLAYQDSTRRPSKRQKDLADIMRIVEAYPGLKAQLPDGVLPE